MNELLKRYPALAECEKDISAAVDTLCAVFRAGGKLLLCGNGGSAADCEHISGELLKGFLDKREIPRGEREEMLSRCPEIAPLIDRLQTGFPAIPLPSLTSLISAAANDLDPSLAYAQAVMALGRPGDALIAISTSGNAENVYKAALTAKAKGMPVVALTGKTGGRLAKIADVAVRVPETETYRVQELHLPVYHYICAETERRGIEIRN